MTSPAALETGLQIHPVRTPGLGDTTYLVTYEGSGLLVDPQRDVDRFLSYFQHKDVQLRWVLETHVHNDYVSGGVVAAERSGAELVMPAAAAPTYRHTPAFHQEDLGDARLSIRPLHTPGHTPEHTSYLILVQGVPAALFSGGSLLVGSAGRPDLLGIDRAETLARLQFRSVNRLAQLPDGVDLYPTHGEGSFCTSSGAGRHTSTIGDEKLTNPVLAYADEDAFVSGQLAVLQPYPTYYAHMAPANLRGGHPMPELELPIIEADTLTGWGDSVEIIDMRDRHEFARAHIPGSLGVELRDDFGTWAGWLVDIDRPLVLVADPGQDITEAQTQLSRIGYDQVRGVLLGIKGWLEAGLEVSSYRTVTAAEFARAGRDGKPVLDVRSPGEYEASRVEGSRNLYVPDLLDDGVKTPSGEAWLLCATGFRASIAAGLAERRGLTPVVLADGGVDDVKAAA